MNQTALVTGASVGLGLEFAKLLAADGDRLVLVARDEVRLNQAAAELRQIGAGGVTIIVKDLSQPAAPREIAEQLKSEKIDINILINNAGFGLHGEFARGELSKQIALLNVNIKALTELTGLILPGMLQQGRGKIMNVASVAAYMPGPLMATYYASKAYVLSFSSALSEECRGSGVTVTAVCPGPTRTEFFTRAGIGKSDLLASYMMSSEHVARIGYRAMMAGKPICVTGWTNWLLAQSTRLLPTQLLARIAGGRNRLRASK